MSLNHQTLGRILQFRSAGKDYRNETNDHAIDLLLTEFPDGTVRKCPRQVDGHNYSKKRNVNEKEQNESASTSNKTPSSVVDLSYLAIANFQNMNTRCS